MIENKQYSDVKNKIQMTIKPLIQVRAIIENALNNTAKPVISESKCKFI